MADHIASIDELFAKFKGPSGLARLLGKGASTASEMKRRQSIPVEYWPSIIESEIGRELDLKPEDLMRINIAARESV